MPSAPVRDSLQTLISFVRDLVGEADLDASDLTDNQVQTALDETREKVRYERLCSVPTILPNGFASYTDFETEGYLEDDATLLDASYNVIDSEKISESDCFVGDFIFTQSQPMGIYLVGKRYDPYQAAADLLTSMAAHSKGAVDFSEVGLSIKSSQATNQMLALAKELRKKARIRSIPFGRSDI